MKLSWLSVLAVLVLKLILIGHCEWDEQKKTMHARCQQIVFVDVAKSISRICVIMRTETLCEIVIMLDMNHFDFIQEVFVFFSPTRAEKIYFGDKKCRLRTMRLSCFSSCNVN